MSGMDESFLGKFRGFLFKSKVAKTESDPKWTGRVVFTQEQIRRLATRAKGCAEGAEIVCESSAWLRKDKNGDEYIFISTNADTTPTNEGIVNR